MTNHGESAAAEPGPFADLIADAATVRRVLHLGETTVELPDRHSVVIPDAAISDRALAVVAGLDIYGD